MAKPRKPGWWYPYIFVGGFVLVLGVNGALAYFATSTFTGLSTDNAYEKGRLYNANLALAREQAAMGWKVDTQVRPLGDGKVSIAISYLDRNGKPVNGMNVRAQMVRPTVKGYDHDITLSALSDGVYGGQFALPLKGVWDMDVAALGNGLAYEHAQRFVIP